jgi:RNA polymerase sigma-70 factor (ECF subfamily)
MTTDEDLMLACREGSGEAFEELFGRYRQPIWGYFRRRLLDSARAEELAQETFVAVLEGARRYVPRAPCRAYLYGIAFNLLAAERRRASRHPPAALTDEIGMTRTASDEGLWVRQALGRLDESDREIVMLREFEQLSYVEIAGLLDLPVNTVRSRLFRARMELRRLLAPSLESGCRAR